MPPRGRRGTARIGMASELGDLFVSCAATVTFERADILVNELSMPGQPVLEREGRSAKRALEGPLVHVD